jgi:hypothetical protein
MKNLFEQFKLAIAYINSIIKTLTDKLKKGSSVGAGFVLEAISTIGLITAGTILGIIVLSMIVFDVMRQDTTMTFIQESNA